MFPWLQLPYACYLEHIGRTVDLLLLFGNCCLVSLRTKDHRDTTGLPYLFLLLATLVGKIWKFSVVLQRTSGSGFFYHSTSEQENLENLLRHQEAYQRSGFLSLCGFSVCFLRHTVLGYEHLLSLISDTTTFISYKPLKQTVSHCAPPQLLSTHRPLQITASSPRKLLYKPEFSRVI